MYKINSMFYCDPNAAANGMADTQMVKNNIKAFGSVSTAQMRTLFQSTSSSSARMRATAVPMCWPISARVMFTVTMPLRN